jgi:site-specific DNA recombinase
MGGVVPLGYRVENRHLVIEPAEALTVQHLFERYLELRSVRALADEASASGLAGKASVDGKPGRPFGRGNLYHLLSNPIYVGKIRHRDQLYPGEHQPIVDADLFERAQVMLATQAPARRSPRNIKANICSPGSSSMKPAPGCALFMPTSRGSAIATMSRNT